MPYGRRTTYRRNSSTRPAGAAAKLQNTAENVYAKLTPVKRTARPMVNKNAIDILARKVASLTRAQHGSVPCLRRRCEVNGTLGPWYPQLTTTRWTHHDAL